MNKKQLFLITTLLTLFPKKTISQQHQKKIPKGFSESIQIIGILAYNVSKKSNFQKGSTYIYSSYYKWLEINNLKWIPISLNLSEKDLISKLEKVNGILLPGGGEPILDENFEETEFLRKIKILIKFSEEKKNQGVNFPIIGTCLGFEVLIIALTEKEILLKDFENDNFSLSLKIKLKSFSSFLRLGFSENEISQFNENNFFYFHHSHAFFKEDIETSDYFKNNLDALAYFSKKNDDRDVLAIFQHKRLPIIAWQFHPEKVLFDSNEKERIFKSEKSIFFNSKFSKIIKLFVLGQKALITDEEIILEKSEVAMTFNYGHPIQQESLILPPPGLSKDEIIDGDF